MRTKSLASAKVVNQSPHASAELRDVHQPRPTAIWASSRGERRPEALGEPLTGDLLVGTVGFEPTTSASRTLRAAKLRHVPMSGIVSGQCSEARLR